MNEQLARALDDMAILFKGDRYRVRAYKQAAKSIRTHDKIILSGSQAQKEIKGIGKSIAAKIDEILKTGTLQILEERPKEMLDKIKAVKLFTKIYGVGEVTAEKWYDMGYHTFESLAQLYPSMTDAQKLGYYYFHQLNKRIPRSEMEIIHQAIDKYLRHYGIEYVISGSYRRGESSSGDIDILVRDIDKGDNKINIKSVISLLEPIIVGNLALGSTKYMGIIKLGDDYNARRMDIRLVDSESWPYAILYFTGSKELNIEMRKRSIELGLSLSEYSLTDGSGKKYIAKTEKDIFSILGLDYLEPHERSLVPKDYMKRKVTKKEISVEEITVSPVVSGKWYRPFQNLFVYVSDGISSQGNIAGFDLDWTLTRTTRGVFPKDPQDIIWLPNRISTLNKLARDGNTIVVFTNQKSRTDKKKLFNFNRMNSFINMIPGIPIILLMSTGEDKYRKPNAGMWDALKQMIPQINYGFYSGDAGGRPQDFSDSDRKFAENAGIPFYTPEEVFPSIERISPSPKVSVNKIDLSVGKTMIVFVGAPGTGKTTYYNTYLSDKYIHINQDILRTKKRVLGAAENNMKQGYNVVIDSTNPGQGRREEFYRLAQKYGYNIVVIYFVRDGRGWNKLREKPVPGAAYGKYYKDLVEPTAENTPGELYEIF
jgi:DNA 3'-phosphatase